ncbi:hypothetical protein CBL_14354 [Carabus blaptoides fortunei]
MTTQCMKPPVSAVVAAWSSGELTVSVHSPSVKRCTAVTPVYERPRLAIESSFCMAIAASLLLRQTENESSSASDGSLAVVATGRAGAKLRRGYRSTGKEWCYLSVSTMRIVGVCGTR